MSELGGFIVCAYAAVKAVCFLTDEIYCWMLERERARCERIREYRG